MPSLWQNYWKILKLDPEPFDLAKQAGVGDQYQVDSAGTGSWHVGESPDRRMRQVAARR